jgi:RNA polymerase sigma-70 factor (ECF subfamily)
MSWFSRAPARRPFETLLYPHLQRLYRLAYRFTGSRDDAEDLVQDLLIKLVPHEKRLSEVEVLAPWLARALYHLYVDDVRRRRRSATHLAGTTNDADVIETLADEVAESPEQAAERRLTQRQLVAAMAQLTAEQRALIAWHDIEGYPLDELASALDVPVGTLKSRLHRTRAQLRRLLTEPSAAPQRVYRERTFA